MNPPPMPAPVAEAYTMQACVPGAPEVPHLRALSKSLRRAHLFTADQMRDYGAACYAAGFIDAYREKAGVAEQCADSIRRAAMPPKP